MDWLCCPSSPGSNSSHRSVQKSKSNLKNKSSNTSISDESLAKENRLVAQKNERMSSTHLPLKEKEKKNDQRCSSDGCFTHSKSALLARLRQFRLLLFQSFPFALPLFQSSVLVFVDASCFCLLMTTIGRFSSGEPTRFLRIRRRRRRRTRRRDSYGIRGDDIVGRGRM